MTTKPSYLFRVTQFLTPWMVFHFIPTKSVLGLIMVLPIVHKGTWPGHIYIRFEVFGDSTIIIGSSVVDCAIRISANRGQTWLGVGPPSGLGQCSPIDFEFLTRHIFSVTNIADIYASFLVSINGGVTWKEYSFGADLRPPLMPVLGYVLESGKWSLFNWENLTWWE